MSKVRCSHASLAVAILSIGVFVGAVRPAAAQSSDARGFVLVNAGLQPSTTTLADKVLFPESGNVGVGWLTRYSSGRVDLSSADGDTVRVESGGLHTAGGLRLRF